MLGASMVEDEEDEVEEEEDEVEEDEMEIFDLMLEYDIEGKNENPEQNHRALVEVFDTHIQEPFQEPNYDHEEGVDILILIYNQLDSERKEEEELDDIVDEIMRERKAKRASDALSR